MCFLGLKHSYPQLLGVVAANTQPRPSLGIAMVGEHHLTQSHTLVPGATAFYDWLTWGYKGLAPSVQLEMMLKTTPALKLL